MKSPWQFVLSVVVGLTAILAIMMAAFFFASSTLWYQPNPDWDSGNN